MRWRLAAVCLIAAAAAAAGAVVALFVLTPPVVTVVLHTMPPGATVFSAMGAAAVTPCRLELKQGERRDVRLVRKGFKDAEASVDARDYEVAGWRGLLRLRSGAVYHRTVTLEVAAQSGLVVVTTPAGADVFLDGDRVGATPLSLKNLAPGKRLLRLAHAQCFPQSEEITLAPDEVARVERSLVNRTEAFYRDRMSREPTELLHHAELIHHLVVNGETAKAVEAIQAGYDLSVKAGVRSQGSFYQELYQIYSRYYVYPDAAAPVLRPFCRKTITTAGQGAAGSETARKFMERFNQYDAANPGK